MTMSIFLVTAIVLGLGLVVVVGWYSHRATCGPQEILIFTGRREYLDNQGHPKLYAALIRVGSRLRWPLIDRVDRLDLSSMPVRIQADAVRASCGEELSLRAQAVVRITADPDQLPFAVEKLLGIGKPEIRQVAKDIILSALEESIAEMTAEDLQADLSSLELKVMKSAEHPIYTAGLVLDSLRLTGATDGPKAGL
jgi:flotillin